MGLSRPAQNIWEIDMYSAKKLILIVVAFSIFLSNNLLPCLAASLPIIRVPLVIAEEAFALPEAKAGTEYEYQFQSEGGLAPLKWRTVQGTLPHRLRLETSGKLHGIPSQARREAYAFLIEVSDSSNTPQRFTQTFLLIVRAAPLRIVINQPGLRIVPPQVAQSTDAQGRNTGRGARGQNGARPNSGAIPINPLGGDEIRADVSGVAENSTTERADGNVSTQNGPAREIEAPAIQKPLFAGDVEIQGTASATDTVQLSIIDVDGVKKNSVPVAGG